MKPDDLSGNESPLAGTGYPNHGIASSVPFHVVNSDHSVVRSTSLNRLAEVIVRRKKLIIGIFLAAVIVACLWTALSAPMYRAKATIEFEKDAGVSLSNILARTSSPVASAIEAVVNEDIFTQMTILKSRILAERLTDQLKLEEVPEFNAPSLITKGRELLNQIIPEALTEMAEKAASHELLARERLVEEVMDRIRVIRNRKSRLITVTIEAQSPELAQEMLETYLDIYFAENLEKRRRANIQAGRWLVDEIKKAEKKALSALDEVVEFAGTHEMVSLELNSPSSHANHKLAIFTKTAEDLVKTRDSRMLLESLHRVSGQGLLALPTEFKSTELEALSIRLAGLEAAYAEASKIYKPDYHKLALLREQIAVLKDRSARTERRIMSTMVASAQQKENLHEKALEDAKQEALKSNSLGVQYSILKRTADATQEIYMLLLKKYKDVQLFTQVVGNNLLTVDPPFVPVKPVRPRKVFNLLLGGLIGVFLGLAGAFLADAMDSKVKSVDDVENLDIPNLGLIPDARRLAKRFTSSGRYPIESLITRQTPIPALTESIDFVKSRLLLSLPESSYGSLLLTSAVSGEGKTFISVLLAEAFSSARTPVLLIEADFRRPRLANIFGCNERPQWGLSDILCHECFNPKRTIMRSGIPGLFYLTSGSLPEHPTKLLESGRLKKVIDLLKKYFTRIIIDAPPFVGLSDARVLTSVADGTIIVVKRGYSSSKLVQRVVCSLSSTNGQRKIILGTVLNSAEPGWSTQRE